MSPAWMTFYSRYGSTTSLLKLGTISAFIGLENWTLKLHKPRAVGYSGDSGNDDRVSVDIGCKSRESEFPMTWHFKHFFCGFIEEDVVCASQ